MPLLTPKIDVKLEHVSKSEFLGDVKSSIDERTLNYHVFRGAKTKIMVQMVLFFKNNDNKEEK